MSFESLNNGIPVVEIIYKSAESEKGDSEELHKYFQVLSQNIAPQFNASEFTINRYANGDYDIDGLTYWCGYLVSGESEKILTYMITTNKEKFSFY